MRAFFSGKKTEKPKTAGKPDEKPKDAEKPKVEAKKPNAAAETKTATPDKSKTPAKQTTSTAPAKTLNPKNSGSDADEKVEGSSNGLNGSKGSPTLSGAVGSALPLSLQRRLSKSELLKPVASFQDTPATGRQALFIQKLKLCTIMFEWGDDANQKDNRAKEVKRQQLLELVEYIGKNKGIFTDPVLAELMNMVRTNFFRPLPPKREEHPNPGSEGKPAGAAGAGEGEEEDPVFEPSWPHLQIVYEFFLRFIVSSEVDVRTLKRHINGQFVLKLLELFDSEDHRERDYLKTILHRIYAKFMSLRAFIRKAINNVFYSFIYDTETHNGVAELLEILGSIINGFALPLKQEHKTFLKKVLTPMHKVRNLNTFHQQLAYCVTQFVDKDPHLAVPVLSGLLKYWPVTNSAKEVLFLNELEELLELTQPDEFKAVLVPLFTQLNKSIGSPHFQVAERVLFLWHNEYVSGLIADHRVQILPVIFPSLHANSQGHWNPTVHNLTLNVLKIFMDLDANLVEECQKKYLEMKEREPDQKTLQARWDNMQAGIAPDVWNGYQAEIAAKEREREAAALAERNRYFSPGFLGNVTSTSTTNASSGTLDAGGKESKEQKDGAASAGPSA